MKPTVCWTIGNTSNLYAIDCLKESVGSLQKLYGDELRYVLRYNNLVGDMVKRLPEFDEVINQHDHVNSLNVPPPKARFLGGCAWKLYPVKVTEGYQISLDNDIVIRERIFDPYLDTESFMITEALQRSYTPRLHEFIRHDFNINTGLVGIPANANLSEEIDRLCEEYDVYWEEYFDEQSVMAMVLQDRDVHIFPKQDISVIGEKTPYALGKSGVHFLGLNIGFNDHWLRYKRRGLF